MHLTTAYLWIHALKDFAVTTDLYLDNLIEWDQIEEHLQHLSLFLNEPLPGEMKISQELTLDMMAPVRINIVLKRIEQQFAIMPQQSQAAMLARLIRPIIGYWNDYLIDDYSTVMKNINSKKLKTVLDEESEMYALCVGIRLVIIQTILAVKQLADDYDVDFDLIVNKANKIIPPVSDINTKYRYRALPITQRIEGIDRLLQKCMSAETVGNKTLRASIIRALSGGNLDADLQNTQYYRAIKGKGQATKDTKDAIDELFKDIEFRN